MEHRTVRLQTTVTPTEAAAIRAYARENGIGVSDLIRDLLQEFLG